MPLAMKQQARNKAAEAVNQRVGFSFYAEDLTALRGLVAGLRERGVRVKRTFLVRALARLVPEDEIFAHGVARHRQEAAGKAGAAGEVDQCLAFEVLQDDVDKLERVGDRLSEKKFPGGRSFLLRALLHAPWNLDELARDVRKFQKEFPDARTRAGRALKHG
ncbi:MAG: hypothetical protein RL091_1324 [Verrucomicrobiota bacterium]